MYYSPLTSLKIIGGAFCKFSTGSATNLCGQDFLPEPNSGFQTTTQHTKLYKIKIRAV